MQRISVIIVDDDPFVCASLSTILTSEDDIEIVAQGHSGPDAIKLYCEHQPNIVLMDIQMPQGDGLSAAETLLAQDASARVVFLTTFSDEEYIVRALRLGARGYLIKQDVGSIAPALRSVMAGQNVLGDEVLSRMEHIFTDKNAGERSTSGISSWQSTLTERELDVVKLIAQGLDNREIAQTIFISEGTVRNNISAILQKLGLKNRTQIAVKFLSER